MKRQIASFSLHPPVIAGVPTGGERKGFFVPVIMNQNEPDDIGSLDYYRRMGETNPDIEVLVALIDRLTEELFSAIASAIRP